MLVDSLGIHLYVTVSTIDILVFGSFVFAVVGKCVCVCCMHMSAQACALMDGGAFYWISLSVSSLLLKTGSLTDLL